MRVRASPYLKGTVARRRSVKKKEHHGVYRKMLISRTTQRSGRRGNLRSRVPPSRGSHVVKEKVRKHVELRNDEGERATELICSRSKKRRKEIKEVAALEERILTVQP